MDTKLRCEPDTERDGDPCKHCGTPGAPTSSYRFRECNGARYVMPLPATGAEWVKQGFTFRNEEPDNG